MSKLVSILIPTRNRFNSLLEAISSIVDKTKDLNRIEIILRIDKDDDATISRLKELPTDKIDINIMIGEKYGYIELHRYVNEMCAETKGEFILWFNDDCIIESQDWDEIVAEYTRKIICFHPNNKGTGAGNIFPLINRKIYELLGHFSMSQQVDTWQHIVCKRAGIEVKRDDLVFIHNREQEYVSDKNRREVLDKTRRVWITTKGQRAKDVKKIREYLQMEQKKKKLARDRKVLEDKVELTPKEREALNKKQRLEARHKRIQQRNKRMEAERNKKK